MCDSGHAIGAHAQEEPWHAPHRAEEFCIRFIQNNHTSLVLLISRAIIARIARAAAAAAKYNIISGI